MTLGEFIADYIEVHHMSIRSFAAMTGISPQQISNIMKGIGNNGKPMTSTMTTYKKVADAVGMSERDFLNMLNDNVTVNPESSLSLLRESQTFPALPAEDQQLLDRFHELNEDGRRNVMDYTLYLIDSGRYSKKDSAVSAS